MVFLAKALIIGIKRIISTIVSILAFRYVYEFVKLWIMKGIPGFMLTIYLSNKVRDYMYRQYDRLKRKSSKKAEFNFRNIEPMSLEYNALDKMDNDPADQTAIDMFKKNAELSCKNDLFEYVFSAATNSSLFSFLTIIAIEYMQEKYNYSVLTSIIYCASIPFFICFGSSYRYSSVVCGEWLEMFKPNEEVNVPNKRSKQILMWYNKSENEEKDSICLWSTLYDTQTRITTVELKFASAAYTNNLGEIIDIFFLKYVDLNSENSNEFYDIIVPDYYNVGQLFAARMKRLKLPNIESWTEFILFPMINFSVNIFSNKKLIAPNLGKAKLKKDI